MRLSCTTAEQTLAGSRRTGKDSPVRSIYTYLAWRFPDRLSPRELDVLRLLAAGRTNKEIAEELFISLNTVLRHVSNIFRKAGVGNRAEAASYAHRSNLT